MFKHRRQTKRVSGHIKVAVWSMRWLFFVDSTYVVCIDRDNGGRAEKPYDVSAFLESTFCGQFVSLGTCLKVMKWFSTESQGKSGILARWRKKLSTLSSIMARRGYSIPCNFSDRTIRAEGAAEFIRRDIFRPWETSPRNPRSARRYIISGPRMIEN